MTTFFIDCILRQTVENHETKQGSQIFTHVI